MIDSHAGMKPVSRQHHFLPQFYLAGFTDTGEKGGRLHVLDFTTRKTFVTTTAKVAKERDFNRVDAEGRSPDALENALAKVEKEIAEAVWSVATSRTYPESETLNWLLNFLGLLGIRNPKRRQSFNRFREQILLTLASHVVSDRAVWERSNDGALAAGCVPNHSVSFESMREFVRSGKFTIEFAPGGNPGAEFKIFDELLPLLGQRSWTLFVAPDSGPHLICGDHPVTLMPKDPVRSEPIGFGTPQTGVYFPLTQRVALYGVFENPLPKVFVLQEEDVAHMNSRIIRKAQRQIYSPTGEFLMQTKSGIGKVRLDSLLHAPPK